MGLVTFCSSIDAYCQYCNVVNHIACLEESERRNVYKGEWVCSDCADDVQDSKESFVLKRLRDVTRIQQDNAQKIIAKYMRRYN